MSSCVSGETNESVQDLDDDNPGQGEKDSKVLADDVDKKNKDNLSEKEVKVEEKRAVLELTASDLLSFAWQISSGMVRELQEALVHVNVYPTLIGIPCRKRSRSSRLGL